ncbi:hypothetical protein C8J57DRAFT_1573134 [Mycena rebaudengoi]|nr:hypothetical protein C8J57DRAFT_1573134 [Mycena rebaudengoi]
MGIDAMGLETMIRVFTHSLQLVCDFLNTASCIEILLSGKLALTRPRNLKKEKAKDATEDAIIWIGRTYQLLYAPLDFPASSPSGLLADNIEPLFYYEYPMRACIGGARMTGGRTKRRPPEKGGDRNRRGINSAGLHEHRVNDTRRDEAMCFLGKDYLSCAVVTTSRTPPRRTMGRTPWAHDPRDKKRCKGRSARDHHFSARSTSVHQSCSAKPGSAFTSSRHITTPRLQKIQNARLTASGAEQLYLRSPFAHPGRPMFPHPTLLRPASTKKRTTPSRECGAEVHARAEMSRAAPPCPSGAMGERGGDSGSAAVSFWCAVRPAALRAIEGAAGLEIDCGGRNASQGTKYRRLVACRAIFVAVVTWGVGPRALRHIHVRWALRVAQPVPRICRVPRGRGWRPARAERVPMLVVGHGRASEDGCRIRTFLYVYAGWTRDTHRGGTQRGCDEAGRGVMSRHGCTYSRRIVYTPYSSARQNGARRRDVVAPQPELEV